MSRALDTLRPGRTSGSESFDEAAPIQDWFRARIGSDKLIRVNPRAEGDGGFSGDLYYVEVRSPDDARRAQEYVLRREGGSDSLFVGLDFSIQHLIMDALESSSDVPVPKVVWVENDPTLLGGRFFVMERIRGQVPAHFADSGWLADASAEERGEMWRSGIKTLARIHAFDWKDHLQILRKAETSQGELAADIAYWERLYRDLSAPVFGELLGKGFDWLRSSMPRREHLCLCWGDARHQNMIFRDFQCVAVLDWEMATLGALEKDLAFLLTVDRTLAEAGVPRLSGLPSEEETIAMYEAVSNRRVEHLDFYRGFALIRALVMQARFMKLDAMPSDPLAIGENITARLLRRFLAGDGC